jgi:hypothetical protein
VGRGVAFVKAKRPARMIRRQWTVDFIAVIGIAVGVGLNVDDGEEEEQTKGVKQGNSPAEGGTCIALAFYMFVPLRMKRNLMRVAIRMYNFL